MLRDDLEKLYINTEHGVFTPIYTVKKIPVQLNDEIIEVDDYTVVETAEESYAKFLKSLKEPQELPKTKTEVRLDQIESALEVLATQTAKNTLLNGGI